MFPKEGLQCCSIEGSMQNIARIPFDLAVMEQIELRIQMAQKQRGKREAVSGGYPNGQRNVNSIY
jgi:hypothetical protein